MDQSIFNEENCVLCQRPFVDSSDATRVTKGIPNLIKFSKLRGDAELEAHLSQQYSVQPPGKVLVHADCRRPYVDVQRGKRSVSAPAVPHSTPKKQKLRSNQTIFQWKVNCFFCENEVRFDDLNPNRYPDSRRVRGKKESVAMVTTVRERCDERNDALGSLVKTRLGLCSDLVAEEAVYHSSCHVRFFYNKSCNSSEAREKTPGRPEDSNMQDAFNRMCVWLENENQLHTLQDLRSKMLDDSADTQVYGVKRIKQKLEEKYKDFIFFAEICGRKNVVCFRNMASWIISDKWYDERKTNAEDEAKQIIETAVKIIKSDLRDSLLTTHATTETFPTTEEANNLKWIPDSLRFFLSLLIHSELKVESIGQCIMKAAMPRSVIPPILFALAVEVDHMFGSKWLNTQLFKLGFAESHGEVNRFKQSVVMSDDISDILQSQITDGSFTTFVADVDHNIASLDGRGTFHGMGVIAVTTNKQAHDVKQPLRTRPKKYVKVDELVRKKGIPITSYDFPDKRGLDSIVFQGYKDMINPFVNPVSIRVDKLWHAAGLFMTSTSPRPNWSGFMQDISTGSHPPKSNITMLPIIDLNPMDESCIYSTLLFVIEQSKKLNISTPSITFDQPLWLKALEIITAKSLNIVPLLGGFHLLMSFYGSIGTIMEGSGIARALENIYGANAVKRMLAGKAFSRANRAHLLVESALMIKLQCMVLAEDVQSNKDGGAKVNIEVIRDLYNAVISKTENSDDIESPALETLNLLLEEKINALRVQSRTARLWLQYIDYVNICSIFIRAARTGDWELHLLSISKMLNLFAATGHVHYTKCARVYLQLMLNLENTHPWLYRRFAVEGLFIIQRSDRFWAGLWPNLTRY